MAIFEYRAINEAGKTVTGSMEATYPGAVSEYLTNQNFMPLDFYQSLIIKISYDLFGQFFGFLGVNLTVKMQHDHYPILLRTYTCP